MSRRQKQKKKYRGFWRFVRIQAVLLLLLLGALGVYFFGGYGKEVQGLLTEAKQLAHSSNTDTFRQIQTSVLYDDNGSQITTLKAEKDVYYLSFEEIPDQVKAAMVSIEDKKFYKHHGVDYKAIVRAFFAMVRNGEVTQGGSTITQQLARTVFLSQDRTWQRKLEEIFLASELEKKYSKDQILEFYLNNIYFGNGYYGIQAASRGYFNTDVSNLDLSEITYLCAIPNNPTLYDPVTNSEHTLARRNRILDQMKQDEVITEAECMIAKAEDITLRRPENAKNNYVETYAYFCATQALMQADGFEFKNDFSDEEERSEYQDAYSEKYSECEKHLYTGGYRIYTSMNLAMQEKLQDTLDDHLAGYTEVNDEGIYTLQGAAVCIENQSGLVKAVVGGRQQDYNGYTLNRAYQSYRQPGSAIKPLLVYTPAFDMGYTPDTVVTDAPMEDGPSNASGSYAGDVTLRYAVIKSINTVAWKVLEDITPENGISYLKNMDFAKLDRQDEHPAAALGGFTTGVSPLEMTAGYATLENDGCYRRPSCIMRITDASGNTVYEPSGEEKQIYKVNSARTMTDVLTGVLTDGTAAGMALTSTQSAGKTGTTNSNKDGWFLGYTKYYTTGVWVGYDMPKELPGLTGASYPVHIWKDFMEQIHEELPYAKFVAPAGSVSTEDTQQQEELVQGKDLQEKGS